MPPRTPPQPRSAPDVLPDSLPGKTDSDVMPDGMPRRDRPETTPDSLPRADENAPIEGRANRDGSDGQAEYYQSRVIEAEKETWFEHPEGSAPALDRLTQERTPETEER